MFAYTGTYKGKRITVMAHGMGMPSIGIYAYELYHFYKVKSIIRIGSCGAYSAELKLGDVLGAEEALSYSTFAADLGVEVKDHILKATPILLDLCKHTAKTLTINTTFGRIFCQDVFYDKYTLAENLKRSHNALGVEMEAFALYACALKHNASALTLLTVSDSMITNEAMSHEEVQTSFKNMVTLALETGIQC
jgi:purine-nucleoside phosphorylase